MYLGKPLRKEDISLPLLLTLLFGVLLVQAAKTPPSEDSSDFWSTAEVSENEGDGVETLCDMSFLQTGLHTESHMLRSSIIGLSKDADAALERLKASEGLPGVPPVSLLQVDEWVEEVQTVKAGEGFILHREMASRDAKLPMSLSGLRVLLIVLKFLLALFVVIKGGAAFSRLIQRQVAPEPAPAKELKEAVSAPEVEKQVSWQEPAVEPIPLALAEDVERLLPAFRGSYDCALSKPKSVGRALRFRARIFGPLEDQQSLTAPMCEEACVWHKTTLEHKKDQETTLVTERAGCVDFVANVEGAPDLKLAVHAKEVRLCFSSEQHQKQMLALGEAPAKWQDFVRSEGAGSGYTDEDIFIFQEEALRVGQLVTLVGDLHRDASGQLLLWPASALNQSGGAAGALLDGVHVLVSDDPSFGGAPLDGCGASCIACLEQDHA